jgi:hypothetical protein
MEVLERLHWVPVLYPVADGFAGTVNTDIVNCESASGLLFQITKGVGATGTTTITAQGCDTVVPGTATAIACQYRISTTPDTWGAWTQATAAAGFATTAGSNQMYQVFVRGADIAALGFGYGRLNMVELVNNPVLGGVNCAVVDPRYQPESSTMLT